MGERDTVQGAIAVLGKTGVGEFPLEEERRLYGLLESHFSSRPGGRWIWESIAPPHASRRCEGRSWVDRLPEVLPAGDARLLFFVDSDADEVPVFEANAQDIVALLRECPAFEYCITPHDFGWMVCETHHGVLVAVGEPVRSRLDAL